MKTSEAVEKEGKYMCVYIHIYVYIYMYMINWAAYT